MPEAGRRSVAAGIATLNLYRDEGLFEKARANEKAFADAMMSLKGLPNVVDIRPIGLICGIDLDPIPGKPGLRGYNAIESMYHEHDLYVRVTMDTICVSPPLIATESDFAQIRDKIATVIKAVA